MSFSHPDRLQDLLATVYQLTADGVLPMPESTHYPLADAATAIRMMSGAQHTGKLVLDIPHTGSSRVVVPPAQVRVFRIERQAIHRGTFGNVRDLTTAIRTYINGWNNRAHPFVWTKTADEILKKANRQTTSNAGR
jgi:hypothetical protein